MNFFQKVSIISTEILSESEYLFFQISRRKMMHFLPTLSQKVGILSVKFFQKVSIIFTRFLAENEYFLYQISRRRSIFFHKACVQKYRLSAKFLAPPPSQKQTGTLLWIISMV
jgi:hypothetical protein